MTRLTCWFCVICVITRHIRSSAAQHSATWGRTREIPAVQSCLHWPVSWREMTEERRAVPLELPTPLIGSRSGTVSLPKVIGSELLNCSLALQNEYTYSRDMFINAFIYFGCMSWHINLLCNLCMRLLFSLYLAPSVLQTCELQVKIRPYGLTSVWESLTFQNSNTPRFHQYVLFTWQWKILSMNQPKISSETVLKC